MMLRNIDRCAEEFDDLTTDKKPGPLPPKRLLAMTARKKHEEGASNGKATASATAQKMAANP